MPFEYGKKITTAEADYITERVRVALIKTEKFDVVSNDQITTMLKTVEKRQQLGTCTSEACIIEVGRALDCSYMLVGKIDNAFGEYTVSGKILNVAEQKYVKADEVTIKQKDAIPESSRILVDNLTGTLRAEVVAVITPVAQPKTSERPFRRKDFSMMVGLTLLAPGLGHLYAEQQRGIFYGILWFASGTGVVFGHLFYTHYKNAYDTAVADFDSLYDSAQSWKKVRGYSSYVLAAVYIIALLDILFTGTDYEKIYVRKHESIEPGSVHYALTNTNRVHRAGAPMYQQDEATGFGVMRYF